MDSSNTAPVDDDGGCNWEKEEKTHVSTTCGGRFVFFLFLLLVVVVVFCENVQIF